jgi:hypothetical protein
MKGYLGEDQQAATQDMIATHATVWELTRKVEGVGYKLFMDNFFSPPDSFKDLATKVINCCGSARPNWKEMPQDLGNKTLKLKRGDLSVRPKGDLTAAVWK